eukprot:1141594-Pelagomonas_calceolata.AAC.4
MPQGSARCRLDSCFSLFPCWVEGTPSPSSYCICSSSIDGGSASFPFCALLLFTTCERRYANFIL